MAASTRPVHSSTGTVTTKDTVSRQDHPGQSATRESCRMAKRGVDFETDMMEGMRLMCYMQMSPLPDEAATPFHKSSDLSSYGWQRNEEIPKETREDLGLKDFNPKASLSIRAAFPDLGLPDINDPSWKMAVFNHGRNSKDDKGTYAPTAARYQFVYNCQHGALISLFSASPVHQPYALHFR